MSGIIVSLLVDAAWDRPWVEASCGELDGEDGFHHHQGRRDTACGQADHAAHHDDWIRQEGLAGFRNGAEIWAAWPDLYPNLEHLPSVEGNLRDLRGDWVAPVAWRLYTLDDAAARWDPAFSEYPDWGSKVTWRANNASAYAGSRTWTARSDSLTCTLASRLATAVSTSAWSPRTGRSGSPTPA